MSPSSPPIKSPKARVVTEIIGNKKLLSSISILLGFVLFISILVSWGISRLFFSQETGMTKPETVVKPETPPVQPATLAQPANKTTAPATTQQPASPPEKTKAQIDYETRINKRANVKTPPKDVLWTELNQLILEVENTRRALIEETSQSFNLSADNAPTQHIMMQQAATPVVKEVTEEQTPASSKTNSSWASLSQQIVQIEQSRLTLLESVKQHFPILAPTPTPSVHTPPPTEPTPQPNTIENQVQANAVKSQPLLEPVPIQMVNSDEEPEIIRDSYMLVLADISFEADKADLLAGALHKLTKFADILQQYPDRFVLIEGHTDEYGSDEQNMLLSQQRAEVVKFALMTSGIAEKRMILKGYGAKLPLADNQTEAGRLKNRRVEITLLK
ncbi:outer membrane protein/peptidoglycan-associated (lipo)protein [Beggiatoa alba B18LD]|uniref:Outer membrane protein/peptidoglycan-associated (Lipo)protein n=1 Tax=Beggiatoa alba B18LD TaxID=395493 RepID=I3CDM1_9GAMM|nr:OmpA family protein [Beggiatoa alba]EIJ41714.1 outer membrane protein/peptidoglycan-associated (lipo)protein [Beggiatoa alba B18LD]